MLTRLTLWAIRGYKRHLSPRKGFSCAYRVAHGGPGCSGFAAMAIEELGPVAAIPAIRQRFAACRAAAEALCVARTAQEDERKKGRKRDGWCDCHPGFDCCDLPLPRKCGNGVPDGDCTPDCCSF